MKIGYQLVAPVGTSDMAANIAAARGLGLPDLFDTGSRAGRRLAIVGGGPSINHRAHALRNWKGDVWAINGATLWCDQRRIRHALFTTDPTDLVGRMVAPRRKGAAILSLACDPLTYAVADPRQTLTIDATAAAIRRHLQGLADRFGALHIPTALASSAAIAGIVALAIGYDEATYFGCECSYEANSHAYMDERQHARDEIMIRCGPTSFISRKDYLVQAIEVANLVRQLPGLKERCGGLMGALAANPDCIRQIDPLIPGALNARSGSR